MRALERRLERRQVRSERWRGHNRGGASGFPARPAGHERAGDEPRRTPRPRVARAEQDPLLSRKPLPVTPGRERRTGRGRAPGRRRPVELGARWLDHQGLRGHAARIVLHDRDVDGRHLRSDHPGVRRTGVRRLRDVAPECGVSTNEPAAEEAKARDDAGRLLGRRHRRRRGAAPPHQAALSERRRARGAYYHPRRDVLRVFDL
mmetsp:Transcript_4956/g.15551  ORF Transcript_4956/g.15551 Transcript_4956/m.15551 type:complete len:204 (+) Transcript_4956:1124-1735(+)